LEGWGCTVEKIILLTVDAGYAIHEITAQAEGKGFFAVGEHGTCSGDVDGEDISFLELFKGRFGAKGCSEPAPDKMVRDGPSTSGWGGEPDYAEVFSFCFENVGRVEHCGGSDGDGKEEMQKVDPVVMPDPSIRRSGERLIVGHPR
jgi:hypothetical protein